MTDGVFIGKYTGKVMKKEGQTADQRLWRNWALTFQKDDPFATKDIFVGFFQGGKINPATGQPEYNSLPNLIEGNFYTVKYIEKTFTTQSGAPGKSKAYSGHLEGKRPELVYAPGTQNQAVPAAPAKKVAIDWVNFAAEYDASIPVEKKSAVHLFALYVINRHKDEFADIMALAKAHFTK